MIVVVAQLVLSHQCLVTITLFTNHRSLCPLLFMIGSLNSAIKGKIKSRKYIICYMFTLNIIANRIVYQNYISLGSFDLLD